MIVVVMFVSLTFFLSRNLSSILLKDQSRNGVITILLKDNFRVYRLHKVACLGLWEKLYLGLNHEFQKKLFIALHYRKLYACRGFILTNIGSKGMKVDRGGLSRPIIGP